MHTVRSITILAATLVLAAPGAAQTPNQCPIESVKVGNVCVDKFEASVWQIPLAAIRVIRRVKLGNVTLAELTAAGAVQLGCPFAPYDHTAYPPDFPANGQWTPVSGSNPPSPGVYAVSIPGVLPSTCLTWFQATQACALSTKHLATNREWQDAVAGTPDGAPCVVSAGGPASTGANAGCVSHWGAFDMVGNVWEWVADWVPQSTLVGPSCVGWGAFSDDYMCLSGASTIDQGPGALLRGGDTVGARAGPLAVDGSNSPAAADDERGFRCAR